MAAIFVGSGGDGGEGGDPDAGDGGELWPTLDQLFSSADAVLEAANALHRNRCAIMGTPYAPLDAADNSAIAAAWAPIPAADAAAHILSLAKGSPQADERRMARGSGGGGGGNGGGGGSWYCAGARAYRHTLALIAANASEDGGVSIEGYGGLNRSEVAIMCACFFSARSTAMMAHVGPGGGSSGGCGGGGGVGGGAAAGAGGVGGVGDAATCFTHQTNLQRALARYQLSSAASIILAKAARARGGGAGEEGDGEAVGHGDGTDAAEVVAAAAAAAAAAADAAAADAAAAAATLPPPKRRSATPLLDAQVFLGGSCNPTTWRRDVAIPALEAAGITYYNPQVDCWTPELTVVENRQKARAQLLLFVIDRQTRALSSIVEASSYMDTGRALVLVMDSVEAGQEIGEDGDVVSESEARDLNRSRHYLKVDAEKYGVAVYPGVAEGVAACVRQVRRCESPSMIPTPPAQLRTILAGQEAVAAAAEAVAEAEAALERRK